MKKKTEKRGQGDELRRAYNLKQLKGGVRGKYLARYRMGTNLVLLSPDVAEYFRDEQSVNRALRRLIQAGNGPLPFTVSTPRPNACGIASLQSQGQVKIRTL